MGGAVRRYGVNRSRKAAATFDLRGDFGDDRRGRPRPDLPTKGGRKVEASLFFPGWSATMEQSLTQVLAAGGTMNCPKSGTMIWHSTRNF